MKIALVILHADPARGGAERYTFDLALALAGRGIDVTLIASTFGLRPLNVECVELGESGVTRLGRYRQFRQELNRHLAKTKYDVVHAMLPVDWCDVYHPHAGIAAEAIARGHLKHAGAIKRALAAAANRVNPRRNAFAVVERRLLKDCEPVVLCLSEYVKGTIRRHYPAYPDDLLATLFNSVDLTKYDPAKAAGLAVREKFGIGREQVVALMVAQDFERKGLREAIEALARVGRDEIVLLVVGKDHAEPYARIARGLGVEGRVCFTGATEDVFSFYAAADFFLLPTRHDPCSLVVLEALAMGLPVISTKQNGACEIMREGVHGFVLSSAEYGEGLVRAMGELCEAPRRVEMRAACLGLRARLGSDRHLEGLIEVYVRVMLRSS